MPKLSRTNKYYVCFEPLACYIKNSVVGKYLGMFQRNSFDPALPHGIKYLKSEASFDNFRPTERDERKLARLQKRLATSLSDTFTGDSSESSEVPTMRKRLRSCSAVEFDNPKIIMRISKGKVTDRSTGSEDEETTRKLRKRKDDGETEGRGRGRPKKVQNHHRTVDTVSTRGGLRKKKIE